MMMSIDATIVATALHALEQDLGAPINWTSWTITAYWFGYVVMLPVSDRLSERFGHRPRIPCFHAGLCRFLADLRAGAQYPFAGAVPGAAIGRRRSHSTDFPGMALLGLAMVCGMFAVSYLGNDGASVLAWPFWPPMLAMIGLGWAFFAMLPLSPSRFSRHD